MLIYASESLGSSLNSLNEATLFHLSWLHWAYFIMRHNVKEANVRLNHFYIVKERVTCHQWSLESLTKIFTYTYMRVCSYTHIFIFPPWKMANLKMLKTIVFVILLRFIYLSGFVIMIIQTILILIFKHYKKTWIVVLGRYLSKLCVLVCYS